VCACILATFEEVQYRDRIISQENGDSFINNH
jgi:hypothetical protein